MNYLLKRTYHPDGTTGVLSIRGYEVCKTIELPNLNNQHQVSCIPEGDYELVKHHSDHLGDVIMLKNVLDMGMIYIHPANDASKPCFSGLMAIYTADIDEGGKVFLKITSNGS